MTSEYSILIVQPLEQDHSIVKSDFFSEAILSELKLLRDASITWMLPANQWNMLSISENIFFYTKEDFLKTFSKCQKEQSFSKVIFIFPYLKFSLKEYLFLVFYKNKYKTEWIVFIDQKVDRHDLKTNFIQKKMIQNATKIFSYDPLAFGQLKAKNRNRMSLCTFPVFDRKTLPAKDCELLPNWKTNKRVLLFCNEESADERKMVKAIITHTKLELFGIQILIASKNENFCHELTQLKNSKDFFFDVVNILDVKTLDDYIRLTSCICIPSEKSISSGFAAYIFAYKKPIICTHDTHLYLVKHEQNGYICTYSVQDILAQIVRFFTDLKSSQLSENIQRQMAGSTINEEVKDFFAKKG